MHLTSPLDIFTLFFEELPVPSDITLQEYSANDFEQGYTHVFASTLF